MTLKAKLLVSLDTARYSAFGDARIVAVLNSLLHLLMRLLFARRSLCSTVTYQLQRLQAGSRAKSQTICHAKKASLVTHKVRQQQSAASVLYLLHTHNAAVAVTCPAVKLPQMEQC